MKNPFCCLLAVLMVFTCLSMGGCSLKEKKFVGEYKSVFVDSQNEDNSISFSLEIKDDGTFAISGHRSFSGTWRACTQAGETQLLCIEEEGYTYNSTYPNAWSPYFSLMFLDDGTLMATPASTINGIPDTVSAFGMGRTTNITMVLFEKQ